MVLKYSVNHVVDGCKHPGFVVVIVVVIVPFIMMQTEKI